VEVMICPAPLRPFFIALYRCCLAMLITACGSTCAGYVAHPFSENDELFGRMGHVAVLPWDMVDNSTNPSESIFGRFSSRMTGLGGCFLLSIFVFLPCFHLAHAVHRHFVGLPLASCTLTV